MQCLFYIGHSLYPRIPCFRKTFCWFHLRPDVSVNNICRVHRRSRWYITYYCRISSHIESICSCIRSKGLFCLNLRLHKDHAMNYWHGWWIGQKVVSERLWRTLWKLSIYSVKTTSIFSHSNFAIAQPAGAVEYTNCISAEGWNPPQRVSRI